MTRSMLVSTHFVPRSCESAWESCEPQDGSSPLCGAWPSGCSQSESLLRSLMCFLFRHNILSFGARYPTLEENHNLVRIPRESGNISVPREVAKGFLQDPVRIQPMKNSETFTFQIRNPMLL